MLPSDRLLRLLLHISLACSLHPGFARVVSFDRSRVTSARKNTPNSVNVTTPCPTSSESPTDRLQDNTSYSETEETSTMPVPMLSRLSFVLDTRRPRTNQEPGRHATSRRRETAAHVALVVTCSATGGVLVVIIAAAILYVVRCYCVRAAEDEQRLLPGAAEKSSPVDYKPLLDPTLACEVHSCRDSHGVVFVPTVSHNNEWTVACQGSYSRTMSLHPEMRPHTTVPGTTPDPHSKSGLPTSTFINKSESTSTTLNGTDDVSDRGVYVIVPRGALGDNTSTTVKLRTLNIAANKLVSSASQMQLSAIFQCSVSGVVELHEAIVIRIPCRTFAPRGWRVGVLYRDQHCVPGQRWKYADQLDSRCRTSGVSGRSNEVGGRISEVGGRSNDVDGRSSEVCDLCIEMCGRSSEVCCRSIEIRGRSSEAGGLSSDQSHAGQCQQPDRYDQLDNECMKNEVGVCNGELSPDPHRYDQIPRLQRPPCEQLQEQFRQNEHQQKQQQQRNSDVLYTYDDDYVAIQTRHLTAVVCVAWPPSAGTQSTSAATHDDQG